LVWGGWPPNPPGEGVTLLELPIDPTRRLSATDLPR
jgi:hypothetical protein